MVCIFPSQILTCFTEYLISESTSQKYKVLCLENEYKVSFFFRIYTDITSKLQSNMCNDVASVSLLTLLHFLFLYTPSNILVLLKPSFFLARI